MPSFENLHPNKKYAYLDGFLCGAFAIWLINKIRKDRETD